jgi:chaperone required for assembly of F1-ATPase
MKKDVAVTVGGNPLFTPSKKPLMVPTQALADAIASEWQAHGKYVPNKMILTSLAYTAIDQIEHQTPLIIETLMVYIDTDALSYRATSSEKLATQQLEQWAPVLDRLAKLLGTGWEVTSGVMPIDQSPALYKAVEQQLKALDAMHLSACCLLASGLSSLALMLSVLKKHMDAAEAFRLSRLEEESQAETWGRDSEADARARKLQEEIVAAGQFLHLLEAA